MTDVSPIPPPQKVVPDMRKQLVRPKAGKVLLHDTGSMRKSGVVGDTWVDMETPPIEDIKEGDLIIYEHPARGIMTAHQVKRVRKAGNGGIYFQCQGTSNGEADNINVDKTNYVGRFVIPSKAKLEATSSASPFQPESICFP